MHSHMRPFTTCTDACAYRSMHIPCTALCIHAVSARVARHDLAQHALMHIGVCIYHAYTMHAISVRVARGAICLLRVHLSIMLTFQCVTLTPNHDPNPNIAPTPTLSTLITQVGAPFAFCGYNVKCLPCGTEFTFQLPTGKMAAQNLGKSSVAFLARVLDTSHVAD